MNRPFRPSRRRWWVAALLFVVVALLRWLSPSRPQPFPDRPAATTARDAAPLVEGDYSVQRVVDGDTLLLTGGQRVRLLAIDTPETVRPDHPVEAWGKEAAAFTRQFVDSANDRVRLTFDQDKVDQHGRHLAYVWVEDRLLNEELVRAGLAKANTHFDNDQAMEQRLKKAETAARQAKRGIWSEQRQ